MQKAKRQAGRAHPRLNPASPVLQSAERCTICRLDLRHSPTVMSPRSIYLAKRSTLNSVRLQW